MLASICFSSSVGRWVDRSPDRLRTLMSTITINRTSVILASALWFFIVVPGSVDGMHLDTQFKLGDYVTSDVLKGGMFALILALGILEALSASGNMMSMERDWVVAAASSNGQPYDLTHLNSTMRRIDLICKLLAPILISVIISATGIKIGVVVVGSTSAVSWAIESICAKRVWDYNSRLQEPKHSSEPSQSGSASDVFHPLDPRPQGLLLRIIGGFRRYTQDIRNYFSSTVWIPSLALSLLHLSALTYSGTFITYLLNVGFSLDLITFVRAASSVVEISSTVVTPVGVQYLSKAHDHGRYVRRHAREGSTTVLLDTPSESDSNEAKTTTGLERLGLWGLSFQLLNLVFDSSITLNYSSTNKLQVPVVFALWLLSPAPTSNPFLFSNIVSFPAVTSSPTLLAFILFFFLALSRFGLWIYDLTTQQLTQTMVRPSSRSSFTGVEYSFASLFELCNYILAMIFCRPEQFRWVAGISWCAVGCSTLMYGGWVWKERGHLVHWEKLSMGKGCGCVGARMKDRTVVWRRAGDELEARDEE